MPVYKYRDVSQMEDRTWRSPGDPELFRAIRHAWEFARRTAPLRFPPGVYKHPTIEAAEHQRQAWEEANFAAFRTRRLTRTR